MDLGQAAEINVIAADRQGHEDNEREAAKEGVPAGGPG
jgi:hypothetical protein